MSGLKKAKSAKPSVALSIPDGSPRLYQKLAQKLIQELSSGKFSIGDRLPAERELSAQYDVSRPAVREAMIALEVLGLIEVRVGSGAYVKRRPNDNDQSTFNVTAFELMEARQLFESEAAALAAVHITDDELEQLDTLVKQIARGNRQKNVGGDAENADQAFHCLIASATRNSAVVRTVEELWHLRTASPECALLLEKARTANVKPVVEEHTAIVEALRSRNPDAARKAMSKHLQAVIDHLLFAFEEKALAETRKSVESTRERYTRALKK